MSLDYQDHYTLGTNGRMQVNISRLSAESPDQQGPVANHPATKVVHAADYLRANGNNIRALDNSFSSPSLAIDSPETDAATDLIHSLQLQVDRQAKYQALIRRVTMAIQNCTELPEILRIAAEGTAQVLNADQGMVLRMKFWDPRHSVRSSERIPKARVIIDAKWSRLAADAVPTDAAEMTGRNGVVPGESFWIADCGICQHAMTGGSQPLIFNQTDDFASQLKNPTVAPILVAETMPSLLMVPLESKNKVLGFLTVQHSQPHVWELEEIELVELLAAQLSSAVLQTETLRQVESLVEERTAQLQQSLELQAKLYEITRKQIEKLRVMNQRMDEFLSTLSHELRTPLTSMMMAIRMLRQANVTEDKRERYLAILEQQCAQETSLVNDLLALQELETKQVVMQAQQVNLRHLMEDLSSSFNQRWAMKGLNLQVALPEAPPVLSTDASSVQRILLELLTNAGKYADPSSTIAVRVTQPERQQVMVTITNFGPGIEAEELPFIFDKFRRCQGMTQQAVPGTGLGLALVKSLLQHLNGSVSATSDPLPGKTGHETTFTVMLPINLDSTKG
jgi:signal transduction histidine kinase